MKIAVTAPTGHVGSAVADFLLESGGIDVNLLGRRPEKLKESVRRDAGRQRNCRPNALGVCVPSGIPRWHRPLRQVMLQTQANMVHSLCTVNSSPNFQATPCHGRPRTCISDSESL